VVEKVIMNAAIDRAHSARRDLLFAVLVLDFIHVKRNSVEATAASRGGYVAHCLIGRGAA
jgi:hypothetical protein